MGDNTQAVENFDIPTEVPSEALSSPALLFLYYRIERSLGIKARSEALVSLNEYIEKTCGSSFVENPAGFERFLSSRESIYEISNFITVNETYFFREKAHFEILSELLPELAKLNRPLKICSAAVSTGCEAYSIAMLLDYHIKNGLDIDYSLDAFDINSSAIETAKNARYTANSFRQDGSSWKHILDLYLVPDNGEYIVSNNIRAKVRFFTHNIMRGLDSRYDVIFFRNSLIYFSTVNRLSVLNNVAQALLNNGYLFLGASETSSVNHPLLLNRLSCDAFYFQKSQYVKTQEQLEIKLNEGAHNNSRNIRGKIRHDPLPVKRDELVINCAEVAEIMKTDEGKANAQNVIDCLSDKISAVLSGSSLAACALYCLAAQEFDLADNVISTLEKNSGHEFVLFLRGELLFLRGSCEEAEKYYQEAAVKNRFFWPAFYRIAILAAEGNRTRYEYKIKKAIESIELSQNQGHDKERNYECFIGGFSSDYFIRILRKKIDTERGVT
jgi:chemotaxis protein methyltransferase CheR